MSHTGSSAKRAVPRRKSAKGSDDAPRTAPQPAHLAPSLEGHSDDTNEQLHRLRRLCLSLPESWEKLSHGTPTFFSGKRVFAMFDNNHHNGGHIGVWLAANMADQQLLVHTEPARYYRPPYVGCKGWIGIELSQADDDLLAMHLREARELIARPPKKR